MIKHGTADSPDPTQKEAASEPACLSASPLQADSANLEGQFGGIKTVFGYHPVCEYVHVCLLYSTETGAHVVANRSLIYNWTTVIQDTPIHFLPVR